MDSLVKALDASTSLKKVEKSGGADRKTRAERDKAELKAFYERELAKYATTKRGGAKAFEDDEDEGIDTSLAAGADDEDSGDEQETAEDRAFIASDNEYESSAGEEDESDFDDNLTETESEGGSEFDDSSDEDDDGDDE